MDIIKEEHQRKDFRDILFYLAESQEILQSASERSTIYKRFEALYYSDKPEDKFRHFYSDIFSVLVQIQQGDKPGSIDILGQNLLEIRKGYQPMNKDTSGVTINVSDSIKKLYDHVSLDIARIGYSDAADRKITQVDTIQDIQGKINVIQDKLSEAMQIKADIHEANNQIEKFEERINNTQKEYISILGIFAAIVIAFTSGITFSASVLDNINNSSIYRIAFITLLTGLVLVNILYGLFYYIDRIIRTKEKQKLTPLIIANSILFGLILLTIFTWYFGMAEERNERILRKTAIIYDLGNNSGSV